MRYQENYLWVMPLLCLSTQFYSFMMHSNVLAMYRSLLLLSELCDMLIPIADRFFRRSDQSIGISCMTFFSQATAAYFDV